MDGKDVLRLLLERAKVQETREPITMTVKCSNPDGSFVEVEDFYLGWEDLLSALMKMVADDHPAIIEDLPDRIKDLYF